MKTFTMRAACQPKNSEYWFFEFGDGFEFEAVSLDAAQNILNEKCLEAGTNDDEYYNDYGPLAE